MDGWKIQELEDSLRFNVSVNGSSAKLKFNTLGFYMTLMDSIEDKSGVFDARNGKIMVSKKEIYFSQDPSEIIIKGEKAVNKFFLDNLNYFKNYPNHYPR